MPRTKWNMATQDTSPRRATLPIQQELQLPLLEGNAAKTRKERVPRFTLATTTPTHVFHPPPADKLPLKRCLKLPSENDAKDSKRSSVEIHDAPIPVRHVKLEPDSDCLPSDQSFVVNSPTSSDGWASGRNSKTSFESRKLSLTHDSRMFDAFVPNNNLRTISSGLELDPESMEMSTCGPMYGRASYPFEPRRTFPSVLAESMDGLCLPANDQSGRCTLDCGDGDDESGSTDGINVIDVSQEWGAFDTESGHTGCARGNFRRPWRSERFTANRSNAPRKTRIEIIASEVADMFVRNIQRIRCVWFTLLYVTDILLKYALLLFLIFPTEDEDMNFSQWTRHYKVLFAVLVPFQILATFFCVFLSIADDDLRRWRYGGGLLARGLKTVVVVVLFGCFHLINVKKVYSKYHAQVPNIIREVEDKTLRGRNASPTIPGGMGFLTRQGTARINLNILCLTGVPYLMCLVHVLGIEWIRCIHTHNAHNIVIIVGICGVWVFFCSTLQGIIDMDVSLSWYVKERFHFDWSKKGSRVGHLQFLYPFVHTLFRISEILLRVTIVTGLGWIFMCRFFGKTVGDENEMVLVALLLVLDSCIGWILLAIYSPNRFQSPKDLLLFIVCSLILFIANIVHFVDQVGFTIPALRISRILTLWRFFLSWFVGIWLMIIHYREPPVQTVKLFNAYIITFSVTATVYWALYALVCRRSGYDIHSVALSGKVQRLENMFLGRLRFPVLSGHRLPVPDVNFRTLDGRYDTALHLAAEANNLPVVGFLLHQSADLNLPNYNGCTPLHIACRPLTYYQYLKLFSNFRLDKKSVAEFNETKENIINLLLDAKADAWGSNYARQKPISMVTEELRIKIKKRRISGGMPEATKRKTSVLHSRQSRGQVSQLVIRECHQKDLNKLFPNFFREKCVEETFEFSAPRRNIGSLIFHEGGAGCFDSEFFQSTTQCLADKDLLLGLRLVADIGQGGFGTVFKVEDTSSPGKFYAIKIQRKSEMWKQASAECKALMLITHEHIVSLEAAFQTPTYYALVMEFCCMDMTKKVLSVENQFGRCEGISLRQVQRYGAHILSALVHLHLMNLACRDVKPDNVLLDVNDNAKLADFGLAKGVPENSDGFVHSSWAGTFGFVAPELQAGHTTLIALFAVDVYAFGMTLAIMLCGERVAEKRKISSERYLLLPDSDICNLLKKCTDQQDDEFRRLTRQSSTRTPSTAVGFGSELDSTLPSQSSDRSATPQRSRTGNMENTPDCTLDKNLSESKIDEQMTAEEDSLTYNGPQLLERQTYELIASMLNTNPARRPRMDELEEHPFFDEGES